MNDPLSNLGLSLVGAYRDNLRQWFSLDSDLNADFFPSNSVSELTGIEEDWQYLSGIADTLQSNFLPEDLINAGTEDESPLAQPDVVRANRNDIPRTEKAARQSAFPLFPEIGIEEAGSTNSGEKRNLDFEYPDFENNSSLTSETAESRGKNQAPKVSNNNIPQSFTSSAFNRFIPDETSEVANRLMKELQENAREITQEQLTSTSTLSDKQSLLPSPQQQALTATIEQNESARSIWTAPLHNLSDFAGSITSRIPEKKETAQQEDSLQKNPTTTTERLIIPTETPFERQNENQTDKWNVLPAGIDRENHSSNSLPDSIQSASFLRSAPSAASSENQAFQIGNAQQHPTTDPEDLLDALTDLIRRDFRRYYP